MADPTAKRRKLTDLVPDARNVNRGTERGLRMLDDSLREDGAGRGILLDRNGNVIAGNKTLERAVDQGFEEIIVVPTDGKQLVATQRVDVDIDSPQGRRMALRDNRVGQVDLEWDADELKALADDGVDLSGLWNEQELAELLKSDDEPTPDPGAQMDRAAELQQKWQVKHGDLWQIGKHRLLCGDSTQAADVAKILYDENPGAIITDPPYSFGLASTPKMATKSGGWHDLMNNASWFADRFKQWHKLIANGAMWVFSNWRTLPIMMRAGFDSDVGINSVMVWYKDFIGTGGVKGLRPTYELITFSAIGDYAIPSRNVEDFVKIGWSAYKPTGHRAEKPVELIDYLLNVTPFGVIFDPFAGSGTTLIACERADSLGRGIEIEPKYCAVILERLSAMGLTPERV